MSTSKIIDQPHEIAIIGAGLGGLTLALCLKQRGIKSRIFELRTPDYDFGGAIMLSPNALRVLDAINVYERIRDRGFNFETLTFMNDIEFKISGKYYFGHKEMYGYKALRIYRKVLLAVLREMVEEQGISIKYDRKLSHVISEDDGGVKFAFSDGTEEVAPILIGADGIHSKVRQYILPHIIPKYAGFIGVTYAFDISKLRFPEGFTKGKFPMPASVHGNLGAFVLAPQDVNGTEIFVGRQFSYPRQDRSGWDVLLKEKSELVQMHQRDMSGWSDFVNSGQEQASDSDTHSMAIWPFHSVPKLETWSSQQGKVVIMGDGAHAIPPTAGQGANQAFEDSFSLAFLLASISKNLDLKTGLEAWQAYRESRVDGVLQLNDQMNSIRLSEVEKRSLPKEKVWQGDNYNFGEGNQLAWLYMNDIEEDMIRIISKI